MDILTFIIVGAVIVFAIAIFYRALKDPVDLVFEKIKQFFIWIKLSLSSKNQQQYGEEIQYG